MKKALVISGGGSKGAFAGGVAEYLLKEKKKNYDIFLGTSTGSLMVSHLALGKIDTLKKMIDLLKKELELKLGQKIKNRGDAELLAHAIQETIDHQISYNTIRRFFGVSTNVKPNNNTLNILAKFIGFKNYIHFTQTHSFREKKNLSP